MYKKCTNCHANGPGGVFFNFFIALPDRNFGFEVRLLSRGRSCLGGKRPRGSRERAPVYVKFEPEVNEGVALQKLPSNFAISFEDRSAQP